MLSKNHFWIAKEWLYFHVFFGRSGFKPMTYSSWQNLSLSLHLFSFSIKFKSELPSIVTQHYFCSGCFRQSSPSAETDRPNPNSDPTKLRNIFLRRNGRVGERPERVLGVASGPSSRLRVCRWRRGRWRTLSSCSDRQPLEAPTRKNKNVSFKKYQKYWHEMYKLSFVKPDLLLKVVVKKVWTVY